MATIAATIITKNEVKNIEDCIKSLLWMDQIIVFDSGSTDGTIAICEKYGAKVIKTDWLGFGIQKNRALEAAATDWIFSIDADERVTPELQQEILSMISGEHDFVAFKVPRQSYVLNRPVKYCFSSKSDAPIRLFKRGYAKFTNDVVHEKIIPDGNVASLKNVLLHFSFPDLATILKKVSLYSSLGAEKLAAKHVKSSVVKIFWHAIWSFIRMYFLKLGFLDGWSGFIIAFGNFEETFYRYAKLLEKNSAMAENNKKQNIAR